MLMGTAVCSLDQLKDGLFRTEMGQLASHPGFSEAWTSLMHCNTLSKRKDNLCCEYRFWATRNQAPVIAALVRWQFIFGIRVVFGFSRFRMDARNKALRARHPERVGKGTLAFIDLNAMSRQPPFKEFEEGLSRADEVMAKDFSSLKLTYWLPTIQFGHEDWVSFCVLSPRFVMCVFWN